MVARRIAVRAEAVRAVAGVVEERHVVVAGIPERRGNAGENLLGADVLLHRHAVRRRGHAAEHGAHPVHVVFAAGQFVRFAGIGVANQQCAVCADGFLMRVRQLIRPVAHAHVAVGENAHRAHAVIVRSAQHSAVVVTVGVADAPVRLGRAAGRGGNVHVILVRALSRRPRNADAVFLRGYCRQPGCLGQPHAHANVALEREAAPSLRLGKAEGVNEVVVHFAGLHRGVDVGGRSVLGDHQLVVARFVEAAAVDDVAHRAGDRVPRQLQPRFRPLVACKRWRFHRAADHAVARRQTRNHVAAVELALGDNKEVIRLVEGNIADIAQAAREVGADNLVIVRVVQGHGNIVVRRARNGCPVQADGGGILTARVSNHNVAQRDIREGQRLRALTDLLSAHDIQRLNTVVVDRAHARGGGGIGCAAALPKERIFAAPRGLVVDGVGIRALHRRPLEGNAAAALVGGRNARRLLQRAPDDEVIKFIRRDGNRRFRDFGGIRIGRGRGSGRRVRRGDGGVVRNDFVRRRFGRMFGDFRRIGGFRRSGRLLGNFRHFGRCVRHFRRIRRGIRHFGNIGRDFGRNVRRRVRHFRRIGDFRRGGRFFRRLFGRGGRFFLLRMHWNRRKQVPVRRHQVVLRLAGNRVICSGLLVRQHFGAAGLDPRRAHNHPIIESNPHRAFAVRARLGVNRAGHFCHIRVARQLLIRVELRAAAEGRQSRHKHVLIRRGGRGFGGSVGRNRRFRRRFGGDFRRNCRIRRFFRGNFGQNWRFRRCFRGDLRRNRRIRRCFRGDLRRNRRIRRRFRGDLRRNRRRGFRHSRLFPDNLLYLRAVCRTRHILRQGGGSRHQHQQRQHQRPYAAKLLLHQQTSSFKVVVYSLSLYSSRFQRSSNAA